MRKRRRQLTQAHHVPKSTSPAKPYANIVLRAPILFKGSAIPRKNPAPIVPPILIIKMWRGFREALSSRLSSIFSLSLGIAKTIDQRGYPPWEQPLYLSIFDELFFDPAGLTCSQQSRVVQFKFDPISNLQLFITIL